MGGMAVIIAAGVRLPLVVVRVVVPVPSSIAVKDAGCGNRLGLLTRMLMNVGSRPSELQRQCEQPPNERPSLPAQQRHVHPPN